MHQALGRQVGDAPADVVEARLGDAHGLRIARQRPVLAVVILDLCVEAVEDLQVVVAHVLVLQRVGGQAQQGDEDQLGQRVQAGLTRHLVLGEFVGEHLEQPVEALDLPGIAGVQRVQCHAGRRHQARLAALAEVGFE
ncbi:hypothetical protein D3C75_625460 [compost metagenome]